jgi:hypothetical protein
MALHLDEGGLVVCLTTDLSEVLNGWYTLLGILEFGSDPQGSATDELIVLDIHDTTGDVAVNDVEGEVESFGTKPKGEVDLDNEVDETRTHVPFDLGLLIHGGNG